MVASISAVTRPPPVPGAASPASAQARCRAAARAERIAVSFFLLGVRDHDRGVDVHRDQRPIPAWCRSPASAQARSRAAARAVRIARSARGASAASAATSRETTGSEATGPNSSGWARSTATSARQSPPNASATARSSTVFPGSCTARDGRHRPSPADRPAPSPVTRAVSVSSNAPAGTRSPYHHQTP